MQQEHYSLEDLLNLQLASSATPTQQPELQAQQEHDDYDTAALDTEATPALAEAPAPAPAPAAPQAGTPRQRAFVEQYAGIAQTTGQKLGVAPEILLSQWALETGWGKSIIPGTRNLGNIKDSSGQGPKARDNMTGSVDSYRAYETDEDFANDYARLISNNQRYTGAAGSGDDARHYFTTLKRGGYAEDPLYIPKATSITNTIRQITGGQLGQSTPNTPAPLTQEQMMQALGVDFGAGQAIPDKLQRSGGQRAKDVVLSLGQGAAGGIKAITDIFGADNPVSQTLDEASKALGQSKSEYSRYLTEDNQQRIKEAEAQGLQQELSAYWDAFWDNPIEMSAQGIGSVLPYAGTSLLGASAKALQIARAAKAAGMSKTAFLATPAGQAVNRQLAQAATTAVTRANMAMGGAMGLGGVKGSQYEITEQAALAAGHTPEQAQQLAVQAQEYSLQNLPQHAIGTALGVANVALGPIEKALSRVPGAGQAASGYSGNLLARAAKGTAAEMPLEMVQDAQQRIAGNAAAIDQGVLDESQRYTGAAGQALQAGLSVAPLGAAGGVMHKAAPAAAPEHTPGIAPEAAAEATTEAADPTNYDIPAQTRQEQERQRQAQQADPNAPTPQQPLTQQWDMAELEVPAATRREQQQQAQQQQQPDTEIDVTYQGADGNQVTEVIPAAAQPEATQPEADPLQAQQDRAWQPAPQATEPVLQNRDRSTASSIEQMQAIAAAPNYLKVGPSTTMDSGAPIVFGTSLPESAAIGNPQQVTDAFDNTLTTQYAVVEAADILTSNHADGSTNPDYAQGQAGKLRTVAGNGRAAGLAESYTRGNADEYRQALTQEAQALGIDPQAIEAMQAPVLVRLMDEADITTDIGDRSNIQSGLQMNAVEQATNDLRRLQDAGLNFAALEFDETGSPTPKTVSAFINAMPQTERGNMRMSDDTPTRQVQERIGAAAFKQAYQNDALVELATMATDEESKRIITAMRRVAPDMAALSGAGDLDTRKAVSDAAVMAINAKRRGIPLRDMVAMPDLDADPEAFTVAQFFADNITSGKRIEDGLRNWANLIEQQIQTQRNNQSQSGMFGATPTLSRGQIFDRLNPSVTELSALDAKQVRAHARALGLPVMDGLRPLKKSELIAAIGQHQQTQAPNFSRASDAQSPQQRSNRNEQRGEYQSGIPVGLPSRETAAGVGLSRRINRARESLGLPGGMHFQEVQPTRAGNTPLARAIEAFTRATGTNVVVFRNLTPEIDDFNGVNFRDGNVYINEDSQYPLTLTAAHEWLHNLKRTDPALYQALENEVRRQGRLPEWHDRNIQEEGRDRGRDHAIEELTAAAVSDALTDPAFLQRLAQRDQSTFKRVARAFLDFLNTLTAQWKDQGSNAYLQDVDAFRDKLEQVLDALPQQGQQRSASSIRALFQRVWHGTPYRGIEREGFKLNAIGTGEGAQAYGWGMYFAGAREVAEGYRKNLSDHNHEYDLVSFPFGDDGKYVRTNAGWLHEETGNALDGLDEVAANALADDYDSADIREMVDDAESDGFDTINISGHEISLEDAQAVISIIDDGEIEYSYSKGQLYSADIPEDSDLLDWDKPLTKQPEAVAKILADHPSYNGMDISEWAAETNGIDPRKVTGAQFYSALEGLVGSPKDASEYLQSLGIPGLRYLDGNSRSAGEGSHNYVIWDEALLTPDAADIQPMFSRSASAPLPANAAQVQEQATPRTPVTAIRAAITKAYGKLLDKLEAKGLVTLTQTQEEAIDAAAQARAAVTGESVQDVKRSLMESVKNQKAWHGTPHRGIEKTGFELNKIGTGAGQKLYGWGMYFASSKDTAEGYRTSLSEQHGTLRLDGQEVEGSLYTDVFYEALASVFEVGKEAALRRLDAKIERTSDPHSYAYDPDRAAKYQAVKKRVEPIDEWRVSRDPGTLYRVEIPEDDVLLDWDKPLSKQPQKVRETVGSAYNAALNKPGGHKLHKDPSGMQFYEWLSTTKGGPQQASEHLQSLGIPGLRYLDGYSAGEGSHNYVIWDEALLTAEAAQIEDHYPTPQLLESRNGAVEGFHDPVSGKTFLIADALTEETAPGTLMHEIGIHMAADGNSKMQKLIARADLLRSKWQGNPFVQQAQERMEQAGETSNEEFLAYVVTQYENGKGKMPITFKLLARDFIAAVRAWLHDKGWLDTDSLSVADLAAIARANAKRLANEGGSRQASGNLQRSTAEDAELAQAQRQFEQTERAYGGRAAYDKAQAAGKTKLNYGQWVQVRTPNFKAWFGDWEAQAHNTTVNQQIAQWEKGELAANVILNLGHPSSVLMAHGVPNAPITLRQAVLRKATTGKHGVDAADLKDIAQAVQAPIAIFDDADNPGTRVAVTEIRHADGNIIAAIRLNMERDGLEISDIRSLHPKRDSSVLHWVNDGLLLGLDKNKGRAWLENLAATHSQQPQALTTLNASLYDTESIRNASKVVDPATGEPLVVYHGTTAEIDFFDPLMLGANTDVKSARGGFFFAASPKVASGYAVLAESRPRLRNELYYRASKSEVLDDDLRQMLKEASDKFTEQDLRDSEMISTGDGQSLITFANVVPVFLKELNPLTVEDGGKEYREHSYASAIRVARENGNDGVAIFNTDDSFHRDFAETSNIYIAFTPTQIKSATGNRGTFDPANADIRFSRKQSDTHKARILQGEPVARLDTASAPMGAPAIRAWASELFAQQGGIAHNPDIGAVVIDERAVRSSIAHGRPNAYKVAAFAAVKDVLEKGALVLTARHSRDGSSFYVSAPVQLDGATNIVTVLVKRDPNDQRMYLHSVALKENLLNRQVSRTDTASGVERSGSNDSGDNATVAKQRDIGKASAAEVAQELQRLLSLDTSAATDIRFSRAAQPNYSSYTPAQQQAAQHAFGSAPSLTLRQRFDQLRANAGAKLRQNIVDQFAPIKDFDNTAYILARMTKGTDGAVEAAMLYGKPYLKDGVLDVDIKDPDGGFASVLASLKGEHDRFLQWVAAQRSKQLKAQGRENLLTDQDISSLLTLSHGNMADGSRRQAVYDNALRRLNRFNDAVLKVALQSGLIDQAAHDIMAGQPYVPFYRLMEETGDLQGPRFSAGLVNQQAWKRLKGGTEQINADLLQNILQNWASLYSAAARNRAAVATIDAAHKAAIAYPVNPHTLGSTQGVVKVRRNGVQEHWMVEDPHLLDAISAMHYAPGVLGKALAPFKRWLTWGVTISPTFKIRNLIRDTLHSIAVADLGYNPADNVIQGWKALNKDGQTYASMLASGGIIRFGTQENNNRAREQIAKLGGQLLDKQGTAKLMGQLKSLWSVYEELGDKSENANRAALYQRLLAKGHSHAEAAFMARDLMDFSMSGKWEIVRFLTQTVPFLNARLQGLYKLGRAAKEDPRRFMHVAGALSIASLALMTAYQDDEDWKKREDWDRDTYWWFKIGNTAYRIPKPFEVGAIATVAERTFEWMFNDEMDSKRFAGRIRHLLAENFALDPTPQALKPILDVYANRDSFTGRSIEGFADDRLRAQDRYNERTSEVARLLGQLGLPDPIKLAQGDYEGLSPKQIDHLLRGYFGWIASASTASLDYALRPLMDRGERPALQMRDVFVAGNFIEGLPSGSSRYASTLYEQARALEEIFNSQNAAIKEGNRPLANQLAQNHQRELAQWPAVKLAKAKLALQDRRARQIMANKTMTAQQKRQALNTINAERHRIAQQAQAAMR